MRKTLIFLHGGPGFKDYLEPYFSALNDSFNCIFYDQLRGPEVSLENLMVQLEEQVELHSKPVLIGHSWGGVLGAEFAIGHSEKIAGLGLICSGLSQNMWMEYRKNLVKLGLARATQEEIFLVPEDSKSGTEFLKRVSQTFSEETFDHLFKTYLKTFDLTPQISSLPMKILNIYAEKDLRFPARVAKTIAALNPNIENFEVKDAGHFAFLQEKSRQSIHQVIKRTFAG